MRDPTQDTVQKTLMFEPHLRVSLPEAAQHEAVSVYGKFAAVQRIAATRRESIT